MYYTYAHTHTHTHTPQGSIDSTRVTCVKWVPGNEHQFVSSHRSGHLYVWNSGFTGKTSGLHNFVLHKDITDAKICVVKPKSKSPILFRWTVGHGAINAFAFSPDAHHIAIASQDGFLRVYDFHKQEIYGRMRSYFGGLLCVCWSPDGRYAVTGGEDDLVTVWSFEHKRVVARGEGHKSYVSAVAFDPHMTTLPPDPELVSPSDQPQPSTRKTEAAGDGATQTQTDIPPPPPPSSSSLLQTKAQATSESPTLQSHSSRSTLDSTNNNPQLNRYLSRVGTESELNITAYRLGSVGQDTQLCLWDLSGDALKMRRLFLRNRSQLSRHSRPVSMGDPTIDSTTEASATATTVTSSITAQQQPNGPSPISSLSVSSRAEDVDSSSTAVGNHIDTSAKRNSIASNRNSTTPETAPEQTTNEQVHITPDDARSSTPSTVSQSSEKGTGKKEKKHKKEKNKDKSKHSSPKHGSPSDSNDSEKREPRKSHRKSLSKMIKFVSHIGAGNSQVQNSHRRTVAIFETCKSDDIAPKMSEVNLIEPLVAKKISNERLTALVFHKDCIITACQEGFIHTWSRPGTELDLPNETQHKKEPASSVPSNPGVS